MSRTPEAAAVLFCCPLGPRPSVRCQTERRSFYANSHPSMPCAPDAICRPKQKYTIDTTAVYPEENNASTDGKCPSRVLQINDGSKTASQDRYSSVDVRNHSAQIAAEEDDPCPCLLCYHILQRSCHGSSHTNRDLLCSCQHTHSSHSTRPHSSATWYTCATHSCTSSRASRSEWGSRPSSRRKGCSSTLHCRSDLSSWRYSSEGIPARVGWSSFAVEPSQAHGVMPGLCWIPNSRMLVGARKSRLALGRIGGTGPS
jgi:hypothetical protein